MWLAYSSFLVHQKGLEAWWHGRRPHNLSSARVDFTFLSLPDFFFSGPPERSKDSYTDSYPTA